MEVLEIAEKVVSIAHSIYELINKVKANKECCQRIAGRVKALEELVGAIDQRKTVQLSDQVEKALQKIIKTLTSAKSYIEKYASANWAKHIVKVSSYKDDFDIVIERLNNRFHLLLGAMQLEHGNTLALMYEKISKQEDDEKAWRNDDAQLKDLLLSHTKEVQNNLEVLISGMAVLLERREKSTAEVNKMIDLQDLQFEPNGKPFMETSTSLVYKGKYNKATVAIKRYKNPVHTTTGDFQSFFKREVETLESFGSPNILQMYGICVLNEAGLNPEFLIVTEYCEMGTLRHVLDTVDLDWSTKVSMCMDAALGLYRLHQTGAKRKIHGCISSQKFLVARGFKVKLAGFGQAKTETSLQRSDIKDDDKELCYYCPQKLEDVNYKYNTKWEIYSFGIVLWEIATREKPFNNWPIKKIKEEVCQKKTNQPLPDDCPKELKEVIDKCRRYDSILRPTAEAIVESLSIINVESF
ncbi:mixed lineage kinase domain-like protein [Echeneis naucrates]|uniref:Protein kinase domain-containing protein n=1 Tax=Echeneis naucrates TaxID=173247 RepID=A0A665T3X0_ECHNA|nr:mixed lineage kinase domain-like protein [Echeneis naucrates]XP_029379771.1 mixed lineage kinase domain-like protein [Echeneis naucrates]